MIDTSSQTIVIVGAGSARLLLAHYLLRRGDRVQSCDRRPDPRQIAPDQQRLFPIPLQYRGRCTHFSSSAARRSNASQVLPQFSHQRVVEAHALRDLSDYSGSTREVMMRCSGE